MTDNKVNNILNIYRSNLPLNVTTEMTNIYEGLFILVLCRGGGIFMLCWIVILDIDITALRVHSAVHSECTECWLHPPTPAS